MSLVKLQVYLSVCFMFLFKQRSSSHCYVMLSCYFTTIFALTFSNILPGFSSLHIFLIAQPFSHSLLSFFYTYRFTEVSHPEGLCVSLFFFSTQALVLHNCSGLLVFWILLLNQESPTKKRQLLLSWTTMMQNPMFCIKPIRLGGQNCVRNVAAWWLIRAHYMVALKQTCLQAEAAQYCLCDQFNDIKTSKVGEKIPNPHFYSVWINRAAILDCLLKFFLILMT